MKNKILILSCIVFATVFSCTDDFNEINEQPDALSTSDVSAKFFVTTLQQQFLRPTMVPLWFGDLIHPDGFSGQISNGYANSDWTGDLGWVYNSFYTDLGAWDWYAAYNSTLTSYMNLVKEGGPLENNQYYAIGLVMKGFYYTQFTETHGMIPYSEASDPNIALPKYDAQIDVYKGVIADLNQAITLIADNQNTGEGIELLGENDVIFNGDMQNWKKLANSLKLRIALRAHGSPGEDFSASVASEAVASGVLADTDALFAAFTTETNIWGGSASYGDIWHSFTGSQWKATEAMVNILKSNDDPRLGEITKPSVGGIITIMKPDSDSENFSLIAEHLEFLENTLNASGLVLDTDYTWDETATDLTITMPDNTNYLGLPSRLSGKIKDFMHKDLFSDPSDWVTQKTNEGGRIFPTILLTSADSHFMIAEAITKGLVSGDANSYYQIGLEKAMVLWETSTTSDFLASEMGSLNGSSEQNLERIATQRWLTNYTNGYESWAIVRDTGYPSAAMVTSTNNNIISFAGELNGEYPQRLRYGTSVYTSNAANAEAAVSAQGPDKMATSLWFAN
jgi:hypothetical protein|tara:strand:- start:1246 stop:2943 length:1698 start_codon:yes stop_codon:yes gene_type:complete